MPSAFACLGLATWTGLAVEEVLAAVEGVDAGEALDQGALAGTVVADERGHMPEADGEVDVVQDLHGTEALVDAAQLEQWSRLGQPVLAARPPSSWSS